jgi:hypothetical protein
MMIKKTLVLALATLTISCVAVVTCASASTKRTTITFSQTVEVPGAILPGGSTYVFKLLKSSVGNRGMVQVTNEAGDKVLAVCLTIPDYRHKTTSHTVMQFGESSGGSPVPLKVWFFPGDKFGYRFVYQKEKAEQIASTYQQPVPEGTTLPKETEGASASTIANLSSTPIKVITPDKKEIDYAASDFTKADASDRFGVDGATTAAN